jgi:hypothetical protein
MSSEDSGSSSGDEPQCAIDEFGRPLVRPSYASVGESSVLSRVREFLPQFKASVVRSFDPEIKPDTQINNDASILIRRSRSSSDSSALGSESVSSFGVEIEVGCGVFDVAGSVDEEALARENIPTILLGEQNASDSVVDYSAPLIEEVEKDRIH